LPKRSSTGIGIAATKKMIEQITTAIDAAYHIGDTPVFLQECAPEKCCHGWATAVGRS
jgi:hypothetical protein